MCSIQGSFIDDVKSLIKDHEFLRKVWIEILNNEIYSLKNFIKNFNFFYKNLNGFLTKFQIKNPQKNKSKLKEKLQTEHKT